MSRTSTKMPPACPEEYHVGSLLTALAPRPPQRMGPPRPPQAGETAPCARFESAPIVDGKRETPSGKPRASSALRRGVTLVELLVVILIMLMITAITIPVIAPAVKNRDVREAARMIDVFINGARTRATQYNKNYGVMIERMPGQPNGAVALSYCEQPDDYAGDYAQSRIRMYGGAFAAFDPVAGMYSSQVPTDFDPVLPLGDMGWIAGPAPPIPPATSGIGWLTTLAPGDIVAAPAGAGATLYRLWAGEPFVDLNQDGMCNGPLAVPYQVGDPSPYAANNTQEPFADVDHSGGWTPPNYPGSPFGFNASQPYVDPASGYFVQPNPNATSPFPNMIWQQPSAFITYWFYDPAKAMQSMSSTGFVNPASIGPNPLSTTVYLPNGSPPPPTVAAPNLAAKYPFSFQRRPVKTSAPGIQLPGGSVIDLGANFFYSTQPPPNVVAIPGSGMEVLVADWNAYGWWSTFRAQPTLDPTLPGSLAAAGTLPSDPTSIIITFQPTGTVDRVYSWSEAQMGSFAGSALTVPPNWTDWQGRIPAGPIYLLIGRQELLDGDPTLTPLILQNAAPLKPIFNVQDPSALWVTINPQSGAVSTAENVGYDLSSPMVTTGTPSFTSMQVYWAANVYYARRLARSMLDMGGR